MNKLIYIFDVDIDSCDMQKSCPWARNFTHDALGHSYQVKTKLHLKETV